MRAVADDPVIRRPGTTRRHRMVAAARRAAPMAKLGAARRSAATGALALLIGSGLPVQAADPVAVRTLAAGTVIAPEDVALSGQIIGPGDSERAAAVVGRQTRIAIYEGREILPANLVNPTLVERNGLVTVTYASGGLSISTEGRALGRGGAGDTIRVLNLASRVTITAQINPDGTLSVVSRQ